MADEPHHAHESHEPFHEPHPEHGAHESGGHSGEHGQPASHESHGHHGGHEHAAHEAHGHEPTHHAEHAAHHEHPAAHSGHDGNGASSDGAYAIAASFIISAVLLSAVILYAFGNLNTSIQQINSGLLEVKLAAAARGVPTGAALAPTPSPLVPSANAPDVAGFPAKGKADAPVTIVEYSDFECPFCQRFYDDTLPSILSNYVDSGKAKIYFKQFPLEQLHPLALKAAEASECARDQNKFWEYHDKLFTTKQLDATSLKKHASDLGLNTVTFTSCLDGGQKTAVVKAQQAEGARLGVGGTPTFFINGKMVVGALPFSEFQREIEVALAA